MPGKICRSGEETDENTKTPISYDKREKVTDVLDEI